MPVDLRISDATRAALDAHARSTYPDECCGFIVERDGREEVIPVTNIQDQQHATDPVQFPRTARTAYTMDPKQQLRVVTDQEDGKLQLRAFYHSHPDHEAYFSEEDKRAALSWDEPSYPGAAQIVLSVRCRFVHVVKAFAWDGSARDFVELPLVAAADFDKRQAR